MSTQAIIGYGTLLERGNGDGPPETFTAIAEVAGINPPQGEADDVEVTHLMSPGRRKEFIQGLIDDGEASFSINWIPDAPTHDATTGLLANLNSGDVLTWRIRLPGDVLIWTFSGYVKSFEPDEITAGDPLKATVTLKVTGASTFA